MPCCTRDLLCVSAAQTCVSGAAWDATGMNLTLTMTVVNCPATPLSTTIGLVSVALQAGWVRCLALCEVRVTIPLREPGHFYLRLDLRHVCLCCVLCFYFVSQVYICCASLLFCVVPAVD